MLQQYTTRYDRATRILEAGLVQPVNLDRGTWLVQSESVEGAAYSVNVNLDECDCPDHAKGHRCKHLIAATRAAELMRRQRRGEFREELDD